MKIAMVTGSYPPDACGIADYTYNIVTALKKKGITVEVIYKKDWRVSKIGDVLHSLKTVHPDITHIQYPTMHFKYYLSPQMLSIINQSVITLHEISQAHFLRKLSLYPFALRFKHIVFTTEYEYQYANKYVPWLNKDKTSIIPIGSNITANNSETERSFQDIVYFGLIRPKKGLEDVILLAQLIKEFSLDFRVRIIGKPDPRWLDYLKELQQSSRELPVSWELNLADLQVKNILSNSRIGYIPFPDGASERRGSLLALLSNGVTVITTVGKQTSNALGNVIVPSVSPVDAIKSIGILARERERCYKTGQLAKEYTARFTWESIADEHIKVYEKIFRMDK